MCIAVLTGPGRKITEQVFRKCWFSNPHGFGMAYINLRAPSEVLIDKGYMNVEAAWKAYSRIAEDAGEKYPMLLHFRAATVGEINVNNCHPYRVRGGAMIHNGTFFRDSTLTISDTRYVAETMHNELTYENLTANKEAFDKAFGYNRVAFLYGHGKYVLFSEDFAYSEGRYGQWHDGIWYSNGGWSRGYSLNCGNGIKTVEEISEFNDDVVLAALDKSLERIQSKL